MSRKLILLAFLFPCMLVVAQPKFTADAVPVQDGQVVFSAEYKDLPITGEEIRKRVLMYLSTGFDATSGRVVMNDDKKVVCESVDSLLYKKQALAVYIMYMRYNLVFDYADGYCRVTFQDMNFMDKEDYDLLTGQRQPDSRGSVRPAKYTAKEIMVDKSYKTLFLKDASGKITDAALIRINEIVGEVEQALHAQ